MLPFSTVSGHISFMDALFTATSAVCVTGLIVQDTAAFFAPFGQVTILLLFQVGGLGILTFSTVILLAAGKRISITDRIIIEQGFHHSPSHDFKSLIKNIFVYALLFEFLGAAFLMLRWNQEFPFCRGFFISLFHSVSAFCNAGFSLFSSSLQAYRGDIWVNAVVIFLIVSGGLGFLVHLELRQFFVNLLRKHRSQLSLHAKLVLSMTLLLILACWAIFLGLEWNGALSGMPIPEKLTASLFQVVTPRTAGFNTMSLGALSTAAVSLLFVLMFIGASPGSTGGGVKTTTIGVIFAFLRSKLAARESVNLFYRTLPPAQINTAFSAVTLGICVIGLAAFLLALEQPGAGLQQILFEVFSAFGTVGLSLGLTGELRSAGKLIIILTMYIGRIGPLVLLLAFSRRRSRGRFEYGEEKVMIG